MNFTYQIQYDKDPTILKTVYQKHLTEYRPKQKSLPPTTEKYVASGKHHDDFFERFMERRVQKLDNAKETTTGNSIPFHIVPLPSTPNVPRTKRININSGDSGVNSSPTCCRTTLSSQINLSARTFTPTPSTSHKMTFSKPHIQPLTPI